VSLPQSDIVQADAPIEREPRILAIANQKGGVGKTTTAINLATALSAVGQTVLITDHLPLTQAIRGTSIANLSLVTAEADLAGAEIEMVNLERREYRLRDALAELRSAPSPYNFVLIDCPPSLGLLTLNGLVAADAVLVPLQCEFYALEGISGLVRTIEMVKRGLNPGLRLQGIVLTMFDRRNNLSNLVAADARGFFGSTVYETVIPRSIRISEAPSHGKPVLLYDFRSPGAQAYVRLAGELLRREHAADAQPEAPP
jgi:chromosome partitioning protein